MERKGRVDTRTHKHTRTKCYPNHHNYNYYNSALDNWLKSVQTLCLGKVQFDLPFINFDHTSEFSVMFFSLVDHWQTLLDQQSRQLVNGFGVPILLLVKFNFVQTHATIDWKMSGYWMIS